MAQILTASDGTTFTNSPFVIEQQWLKAHPDDRLSFNPNELLQLVVLRYDTLVSIFGKSRMSAPCFDGYAPFCKLVSIPLTKEMQWHPNAIRTDQTEINDDNKSDIQFYYHVRSQGELPMPCRLLPCKKSHREKAQWLQVILYSDEQCAKEDINHPDRQFKSNHWQVVLYKGQKGPDEIPMEDTTMIRNALGVEEGGSGIPIDPEKWTQCILHWKNHVKYAPMDYVDYVDSLE